MWIKDYREREHARKTAADEEFNIEDRVEIN
jgi:hypothetical protein